MDEKKAGKLIIELKRVFRDVDQIIHAGDICNLDFLNELEQIAPIKYVVGEDDNISNLQKFIKINSSYYDIGVIHKLPTALEEFCRKNNLIGGILIYGHTHIALINGTDFNTLLLNPGSPTNPKAPNKVAGFKEPKARASVLTLEIDNKGIVTSFIINLSL